MMRLRGVLLVVVGAACISCTQLAAAAPSVSGGDAQRGREAIGRYGCTACHQISGIPGPQAKVGPPLSDLALRRMIGGRLPNTPEDLVHWIQSPQEVSPGTDMPDLGVSDQDARDIAQYLYHQQP